MELWKLIAAPIICGLIGWITNILAVKMLFHPRKPLSIGPFSLQGVFPKRQMALAKRLGDMVDSQLINIEEITCALKDDGISESLRDKVDAYVETLLREKLAAAIPMAAMFLNDETVAKLKGVLVPEIEKMIPELLESAACELENRFDVGAIVRQKIENFTIDKLEDILFSIMKKEFTFIEYAGGALGFIIGIFQSALFYFTA
ncbi:MAG: DUF445 domain-containing protein [Desulfovibrio sp.]|uniref:DUF445 domain-containing protein n=1 Tax=Desulfovibrio sp. 7SRBS1 TaxID=3378064 RepID=UPI003B3C91A6